MAGLRGGDRPGHHEHARDPVRRRRRRSRRSSSASTSRSIPAPGGSSTTPARCGERTREVIEGALARARRGAGRRGRDRHHQPARDDRRVGPPHRRAGAQRDRLAGHAHRRARARAARGPRGWTACASSVGLPLSTYFSGPKIAWILDNVPGRARARAERGELAFGNMDTWLLWNLTGGPRGGVHATDVTNASRTMLMDLRHARMARAEPRADGHSPRACSRRSAPRARSTARRVAGRSRRPAGGGHRSATSRRRCSARRASSAGEAKNTYGTGSFLLVNTGEQVVRSQRAAHERGGEGRASADQLRARGLDRGDRRRRAVAARPARADRQRGRGRGLARTVQDNGGVYFVPAFSGLFAPYWRDDARGVIVGPDRVRPRRAHRPRGARGDRLADARGARRGQRGRRGPVRRAAGRRRHDRQRAADAVPGRRARPAGDPAAR